MCSVVKQNIHFLGISRFSHSLLLVLLSPVVQFSRTNVLCLRLWYYIISQSVCQALFQKFFKNFFQAASKWRKCFVLYHILEGLSRGFWNFFEVFSSHDFKDVFRHTDEAVCRKLDYYSTRDQICQAGKAIFSLCKINIISIKNTLKTGIPLFWH